MAPFFPQLLGGATAQFPFRKHLRYRTIQNELPGDVPIRSLDRHGAFVLWELSYEDMTDEEASALRQFYVAQRGRHGSFVFIDPAANIFRFSERLTADVWRVSGLEVETGSSVNGFQIHRLQSNGPGGAITQACGLAPGANYCVSCYVKGSGLLHGTVAHSTGKAITGGSRWVRLFHTASVPEGSSGVEAGLMLVSGSVEIYGFQLEAQQGPSSYTPTAHEESIYQDSRFADDTLAIVSVAPNRHSCSIRIRSKLPS